MDARLFDVLHDAADDDPFAVADRVDVDLIRILQKLIDENRAVIGHVHRLAHVAAQGCLVVDDGHGPAAQHVGGAHHHRVPDPTGNRDGFFGRIGRAVDRGRNVQLGQERAKAIAIFGQIDGVGRGAEDGHTRLVERPGQVEGRLAAVLDDEPLQRAGSLLAFDQIEHIFQRQRLEVEAVAGVVVGAHRLRVAVDHDRFDALLG